MSIYNAFDTLQIRYITVFRYFTVSIFPLGAWTECLYCVILCNGTIGLPSHKLRHWWLKWTVVVWRRKYLTLTRAVPLRTKLGVQCKYYPNVSAEGQLGLELGVYLRYIFAKRILYVRIYFEISRIFIRCFTSLNIYSCRVQYSEYLCFMPKMLRPDPSSAKSNSANY